MQSSVDGFRGLHVLHHLLQRSKTGRDVYKEDLVFDCWRSQPNSIRSRSMITKPYLYTLCVGCEGSKSIFSMQVLAYRAAPTRRLLDSRKARGSDGWEIKSQSWDISAVRIERFGSFLNAALDPRVAANLETVRLGEKRHKGPGLLTRAGQSRYLFWRGVPVRKTWTGKKKDFYKMIMNKKKFR